MAREVLFVVCDSVARDIGGKASLSGLFTLINPPAVPAKFPRFSLFIRVRNEQKSKLFKLKIDIYAPRSKQPETVEFEVTTSDAGQAEYNFQITEMVIAHYGTYRFVLRHGTVPWAETTFEALDPSAMATGKKRSN
jgi:hypothetical protein